MKIGYRIIKTGIAVTITAFVCNILKLEPALFGAVSAVINMQPSANLTFKTAKGQIYVHIFGILVGLVFGYLVGGNPITIGLVAMIVIIAFNKIGLQTGIPAGIVTAIFILTSAPDQFLANAFTRSTVILLGLIVAMVVNFTLWPPRYNQQFIDKLRKFNEKAVTLFCRAVNDFVKLDKHGIITPQDLKEETLILKQDLHTLAGYLTGRVNNWQAKENLMEFSDAILDKAERIYELMPKRHERRQKLGMPPISDEFKSILRVLTSGCSTIVRVNEILNNLVCNNDAADPEEIDELYWEKLTKAIEEWQQHTNIFYVHALMDVAVVASEMKWVAQEAKRLINTYR